MRSQFHSTHTCRHGWFDRGWDASSSIVTVDSPLCTGTCAPHCLRTEDYGRSASLQRASSTSSSSCQSTGPRSPFLPFLPLRFGPPARPADGSSSPVADSTSSSSASEELDRDGLDFGVSPSSCKRCFPVVCTPPAHLLRARRAHQQVPETPRPTSSAAITTMAGLVPSYRVELSDDGD